MLMLLLINLTRMIVANTTIKVHTSCNDDDNHQNPWDLLPVVKSDVARNCDFSVVLDDKASSSKFYKVLPCISNQYKIVHDNIEKKFQGYPQQPDHQTKRIYLYMVWHHMGEIRKIYMISNCKCMKVMQWLKVTLCHASHDKLVA